jgi:hypothetical protein
LPRNAKNQDTRSISAFCRYEKKCGRNRREEEEGSLKECPVCNDIFGAIDFLDRPKNLQTEVLKPPFVRETSSAEMKQCDICKVHLGSIDFPLHAEDCEKIQRDELLAIQLCCELQSGEAIYVQKECEMKSKAAYANLLERFRKLKRTEADLEQTDFYKNPHSDDFPFSCRHVKILHKGYSLSVLQDSLTLNVGFHAVPNKDRFVQ